MSIEEAFLQTTSLPWGLTLRAGRFFSGIGYLNEQHSHTWDFADQALPYRVFLNNQYDDDGVQLRWLAPTRQFLEFGAEVFRGDAFPAAGPAHVGFGSHSLFAHTGGDIDDSSSYRIGSSWLRASARDRATAVPDGAGRHLQRQERHADLRRRLQMGAERQPGRHQLQIAGRVLRPPRRRPVQQPALQFRLADRLLHPGDLPVHAALAGRAALRPGERQQADRACSPAARSTRMGTTPRRASAMLEYNTSEFGRFRLQYNRDWSRGTADDQAILQYIISLGAHGAHIF